MKPIKSNFDMTPQEQKSLFTQASAVSEAHAKDLLQQLLQKGVVKEGTDPVELSEMIVKMARPIRSYLIEQPSSPKVIS